MQPAQHRPCEPRGDDPVGDGDRRSPPGELRDEMASGRERLTDVLESHLKGTHVFEDLPAEGEVICRDGQRDGTIGDVADHEVVVGPWSSSLEL